MIVSMEFVFDEQGRAEAVSSGLAFEDTAVLQVSYFEMPVQKRRSRAWRKRSPRPMTYGSPCGCF